MDGVVFPRGFLESQGRALAVLAAGYVLTAICSIGLLRAGEGVAGLWIANVFAVALLLRSGSGISLAASATLFGAAMAANFLVGNDLAAALLYSCGNAGSVLLGVKLVGWWRDRRRPASDAGDHAVTLLLSGGLAPAIAGSGYALVANSFFGDPVGETFWAWWSGDALGFAMLLPVFMNASRATLRRLGEPANAIRLAGATAACSAVALAAMIGTSLPFVLLLMVLMVAATVFAPFELGLLCAASGISLIAAVFLGLGPGFEDLASTFQISLAITVVFPFLGGLFVEQHRRDRRQVAESEQRFRRAMEDSAIGVAIVGLDGRIERTNRAFAQMLDYAREELEQKTFFQITHPDDLSIGSETMRAVRAGEATTYRFEKRYLRKDGTAIWAQLAGSVILDERTGAPLYLVSQIEDIDSRKRSAEQIAEAETRWEFALASAGQGIWDYNAEKGYTSYSSTWKSMLGYGEDELDGDSYNWLTLVHPEDRERVEQADKDYQQGKTALFEAEFRMRRKDGSWIWILDRGKIVSRDEKGQMRRAIGTLTDITARKEAEQRLAESAALLADEKERLSVTLRSIGDAVICTDAANRVTFMNPVAETLTGIAAEEALGRDLGSTYASVDEETGATLTGGATKIESWGKSAHNSRAVLVRRDGTRCSIREVVSPILTEKHEFGGCVIVFQDFTDARTLQRELAHAASHDVLTGLANRSSFLRTMAALVAEAHAGPAEHQFLYLDLDHFKSVNDTGGHAAGDRLLREIAAAIRAVLRPGDVVARLGGDEFAIVLKDCAPAHARDIAEALTVAIRRVGASTAAGGHRIGASVGIAPIASGCGEVDDVIARADEACYEAKSAGRGRAVVARMGTGKRGPGPKRKPAAA